MPASPSRGVFTAWTRTGRNFPAVALVGSRARSGAADQPRHRRLSEKDRQLLTQISVSTIDRLLKRLRDARRLMVTVPPNRSLTSTLPTSRKNLTEADSLTNARICAIICSKNEQI